MKSPKVYFGLLALIFLGWGQRLIIQSEISAGLQLTTLGILFVGLTFFVRNLAFLKVRWLMEFFKKAGALIYQVAKTRSLKTEVANQEATLAALEDQKQVVQEKKRAFGLPDKIALVELNLPKLVLIIVGILLLVFSQVLLIYKQSISMVFIMLFSIFFLYIAIRNEKKFVRLGLLGDWIRCAFIGLPGLALILIGNLILIKHVFLNGHKEIIGITCNTIGILFILALMPNHFCDSEQSRYPLNEFSGKAQGMAGVILKALLVLVGAGLLLFARQTSNGEITAQGLAGGMLGIGLIGLSFPWQQGFKAHQEPGLILNFLKNIFRLTMLGLALYLGYRAQSLISHEEISSGLTYFAYAGIALIFAFKEPTENEPDTLQEKPFSWYWEALGLVLILGFAIWVRSYMIDTIPYGIECDEAGGIVNAREILNHPRASLVAHASSQPVFFLAQLKVFHWLFGIDNIGVKFHSILYGVLSIFALFMLVRTLFGPRAALACAALMAISRYHIHYSRFGFGNTLLGLLLLVGFYFLVKGVQERRKWYYIFSGMSFALSMHIAVQARLVPFICFGILVYLIIQQRNFFVRNWKPTVALLLGAWLAGGALFIMFAKSQSALFGRVKEVSVFSGDVNAPRNIAQGIVNNIRINIAQFNWHGDYRTRHNGGLSGEPLLQFWPSILFALGFCFSLYHWKKLRYFILIIWFSGFMSAAVFSIEPPQSDRIFGMTSTVFLFMGVFIDRARRLLQHVLGRTGVLIGGIAFVLFLIPVAKDNYHKYFDTIPAFDSNCTAVAKHIGKYRDTREHFLMSAYFWPGHPPYRAYSRDLNNRFFYTPFDVLPVYTDTDKDINYSLVLEYEELLPSIQWFYPKGQYFNEFHPKYGSMFKAWHVKNEDVQATRGLIATYWNNSYWAGVPALTEKAATLDTPFKHSTWPLSSSQGSVSWAGTLWVPHHGNYTLYLYTTDEAELQIGHSRRLSAKAREEDQLHTWLAGGLHRLRGRAKISKGGKLLLAWSSQDTLENYHIYKSQYNKPFFKEPIPHNHFFSYKEPRGLLETFYVTNDWSGKPSYQQVQPAVLVHTANIPYGYQRPVTIEWKGWIDIKQAGQYAFDLEMPGYGEVEIDQRLVYKRGGFPPGYANNKPVENGIQLSAGKHIIRARFYPSHGYSIKLKWKPPGQERVLIPAGVLTPAEE